MSFAATEATSSEESFETFDSFEEGESGGDSFNDDWSKPEAPEKEAKVKDEGLKVLDDTDVDADGDVVEKEDKPKKEPKKARKEAEVPEEEEKPLVENEDNALPEDKKGKKLRLRMSDGDLYNIDADSTIPVKIDGETQEIPMQELINNYSGKTAWDKKFTEIGKEKKTLEFEKHSLESQKTKLTEHINNAISPLTDPNKNPLDSILYLVELSGQDPYPVYRRLMEANLEEVGGLMDMSEVERELYFHKKKDELNGKVTEQRKLKTDMEQASNQAIQKVDKLRQVYNVSEDEFVDASEELVELLEGQGHDIKNVTHENIVEYASLKPHIAKVKVLVEPFEDNISREKYGDLVADLSRFLRDGKGDEAKVKEILKRNFSVDEEVKELNTKVYQKGQKASKAVETEDSKVESFDDWD